MWAKANVPANALKLQKMERQMSAVLEQEF